MGIFRSRRRIRREAAEWVARLGGGAGESDHVAFRAWYEVDLRNAEAYDRMAAIWSASGRLSMPAPVEAESRTAVRRRFAYAIAASVLVLIAVALLLIRGPVVDGGLEPDASYATSNGELRQIILPDGSRVMLDASSRIELAYSDSERHLFLREGRARFSVAHEARPFIVQAGPNQVVATGTVFDVSLLDSRLSVVLLEGSVELRQGRGTTSAAVHRVSAGQRLVIQRDGTPISAPAAANDTSWTRGMLEFDNLPLGDAVDTANRYSRVQIRIADDQVRALRVTGAYRAGDAIGLARSLAAAFDLELRTETDGSLTLSRRAASR